MADQSGERIKGYQLLERIGTGGFGAVYRSAQSTLGREVAIKVILPGYSNHPDFIRRFEIEAQVVARLEHLHIVPLYDYWRDPSGAYLVMRWMRGGSLAEELARSALNIQQAATALDQLASGLAAAHRIGVIHRDIKPSNILLDEEGNVYLSDFGIASGIGFELEDPFLNQALGSPAYISPEQARNEDITPQSDIYCLGLALYEMLTGSHPFPNLTTVEQFFDQINTPLPIIENLDPEVRSAVNDLIQVATAKDPQKRYRDPLEMAAEFRKAVQLEIDTAAQDPLESLTKREIEIWRMIAAGKSNKDIARELFVELSTVKWHITQLYRKIEVRTRIQAIKQARETAYLSSMIPDQKADQKRYSTASLLISDLKNPYKGLQPFESADSQDYFGREVLIERLLERLSAGNSKGRFLALVGPSGSGKSSLVKAGLLPGIWKGEIPGSQNWFTVEMTPGSRPLEELEVALTRVAADQSDNIRKHLVRDKNGLLRAASLILPKDDSKLVLFIDQFEEIFTMVPDVGDIKFFIDLLSSAISDDKSRVVTIITLRADFYDKPLQYAEFGELMSPALEPVLPLTAEELERAIVQPAQKQGVKYESGLVARIIEDVHYQPAALPLLQHALMELFDLGVDRLLSRAAYDAIGGTVGAVAKRAEDLYQEMYYPSRDAAKQLFLRLVILDEDSEGRGGQHASRYRIARQAILEVAEDEEIMEEVIDSFAAYRLLSLDHDPDTRQPTVELAHEALLAEWDRFASWVDEYRFDLLQNRRLQDLAVDWQESDQDPSYLLRGARLEQTVNWSEGSDFQISAVAREFLEQSLDLQRKRQEEEILRQQRELDAARKLAQSERQRADEGFRAARRLRMMLIGITAALGAVIVLAGLAFTAYQSSEKNRMVANSRELAAAAVSKLESDPGLALLLALKSVSEDTLKSIPEPREALQALHAAVQSARFRKSIISQDPKIHSGFFIPDSHQILVTYVDGSARIIDTSTEEILATFEGHTSLITHVAFHPELSLMATCSRDHTALIWDLETGERLQTISDGNQVFSCVFHPSRPQLITAGNDIDARLWNVYDGELVQTYYGHSDYLSDVEITPDGSYLITSSLDSTIKVWDLDRGYVVKTLHGHDNWVQNLALNYSGTLLASAAVDGSVIIWDTSTWEIITEIRGHAAAAMGVIFSPDGELLATSGQDQLIKIWDPKTGREILALSDLTSTASGLSIDDTGGSLAASSLDGQIFIWDLSPASELAPVKFSGGQGRLSFHPDRSILAVPLIDPGRLLVVDPYAGETLLEVYSENGADYTAAAFSPSGSVLAAGRADGGLELWDLDRREPTESIQTQDDRVNQVAFSPDGKYLIVASEDFSVLIWDVAEGIVVRELEIGSSARAIAVNPNSTLLAVGSEAGLIHFYDLISGEQNGPSVSQKAGLNSLVYSLNDDFLAAASQDGRITIWDLTAHQEVTSIRAFSVPVTGISISDNGTVMAAVGADGLVKIYETVGWQELLALPAGSLVEGPYFGVEFDSRNDRVAVGGENAVRFILLDDEELHTQAESRLMRDFSYQECQTYLHGEDCSAYLQAEMEFQAGPANTLKKKACQITDIGGLQDNAINMNVYQGLRSGADRFGWDMEVIETIGYQNLSQYIETALGEGCDLIITIYFDMGGIAQTYAEDHPEVDFLLLDYLADPLPENVRAQVYAADQAAFLAGYSAASLTESGIVGTFGGINYPSVASFMIGFEQGVSYYNQRFDQQVQVLGWDSADNNGLFIGDFCCFEEGYSFAEKLIAQGADIIMPVAGPFPGIGAVEAARNNGVVIIGVDFDWAGSIPDFADLVLTSVEKRYNVSVLNVIAELDMDQSIGGLQFGTLASGDVGISSFHGFEDQISLELKAELAEITAGIIAGQIITVP